MLMDYIIDLDFKYTLGFSDNPKYILIIHWIYIIIS